MRVFLIVVVVGVAVWLFTRPAVTQSHVFAGLVGLGTLVALVLSLLGTAVGKRLVGLSFWRIRMRLLVRGLRLPGVVPSDVKRQRAALGDYRGTPARFVTEFTAMLNAKAHPSELQARLACGVASFRSPRDSAQVLMQWGEALKRLRRNVQAERVLAYAKALVVDNPDKHAVGIYTNLATVQRYQQKYNEARATLEEAEKLWPHNVHVLWSLALLLKNNFVGQSKEAIARLEELPGVGLPPDGPVINTVSLYSNLGELYMADQREAQAEDAFDKALAACRAVGNEFKEGRTLSLWGDAFERVAKLPDAVRKWQSAEPLLARSETPPQRYLRHVRLKLRKFGRVPAAA